MQIYVLSSLLIFAIGAINLNLFITPKVPMQKPVEYPLQDIEEIDKEVTSVTPDKTSYPQKLLIPKINLISEIEIVGLEPDGKMSVPEAGTTVGWYKYGPLPGQTGNSVLAAHYDTSDGPAIFYRLSELKVGDEIQVRDNKGKALTFEIYDTEIVDVEKFDVYKVYGNNSIQSLNLITCHGVMNPDINTYSQRFIAYSKLKTAL